MITQLSYILLTLFSIGALVDVFLMSSPTLSYGSDLRIFLLLCFWLFIVKVGRLGSIATFKLALIFLAILFFLFTFFRTQPSVERTATWIYLLLLIGIIQQFFDVKKEKQHIS